jgi:hypothetical protein
MSYDDDEDYSEIETPDFEEPPIDPIAARAASFTKLVALYDHIRDDEAKKEILMMLKAIRRSFKTIPTADDITHIQSNKS